jgi:uncharacterized protein with gpF-like domain
MHKKKPIRLHPTKKIPYEKRKKGRDARTEKKKQGTAENLKQNEKAKEKRGGAITEEKKAADKLKRKQKRDAKKRNSHYYVGQYALPRRQRGRPQSDRRA